MRGGVVRVRFSSPRRRLAIALFAVPAILVGVLAMNLLTATGMSDHGTNPASAAHQASDTAFVHVVSADAAMLAPIPSAPALAEVCGALCGPSHVMFEMVCVLALLVTVVLFTVRLIPTGGQPLKRVLSALVAKAASLAPPPPPSLHVLSISRT